MASAFPVFLQETTFNYLGQTYPGWAIMAKHSAKENRTAVSPFRSERQAQAWLDVLVRATSGQAQNAETIRDAFLALTGFPNVSPPLVWNFGGFPGSAALPAGQTPASRQELLDRATTIVVTAATESALAATADQAQARVELAFRGLQELAQSTGADAMGGSGPMEASSSGGFSLPPIGNIAGVVSMAISRVIFAAADQLAMNVDQSTVMNGVVRGLMNPDDVLNYYKMFLAQLGIGAYEADRGPAAYASNVFEAANRLYQRRSASGDPFAEVPDWARPPSEGSVTGTRPSSPGAGGGVGPDAALIATMMAAMGPALTIAQVQAAIDSAVTKLTTGRVYVYQLPDGTITRQGGGIIAPPGSKLLRVENEAQVAFIDTATGRTIYLAPGTAPPPNYVPKESALIGGTRYSPAGTQGVTPAPGRRGGSSGYSPPAGVVIKTPEQLRPAQPATVAGSTFIVLPRAFARKPPTEFTYVLPAGEAARVEKETFRIPNMGFSPARSKYNRF